MSFLVYGRPMPVEPDALWRDGTRATASLQIEGRQLANWARKLGSLDLPGEFASTYSIASTDDRGAKPDGILTMEYLKSHAGRAGLHVRSTAIREGWNVSRWVFVLWKECAPALFARIEETCETDDLKALVRSLARHWELNATSGGGQATSP